MDSIEIEGGRPLEGTVSISGAKNACLALMPAALLSAEPVTLVNAPNLTDIAMMKKLLQSLGAEVHSLQDGHVLTMSAYGLNSSRADYDIVRKMRASILVLGPLLARRGHATVSLPGGCAIGARPVNLHLEALEKLGASLDLRDGYVHAHASRGLRGAVIDFPTVSVGATENAIMAASLAKGTTEIRNAAKEPEVVDLVNCLRSMGARIEGAGESVVTIEGVERLEACTHSVVPDRIELGTYMLAAAITSGEIEIKGGKLDLVESFAKTLREAGIEIDATDSGIRVKRTGESLRPVNVATAPFPGFPTDLQAQLMATLAIADGTSNLEECIFENRFMHAPELVRMGADISVSGGKAVVNGVDQLIGAPVMATDLRASVSLVLAGLAATGTTRISRVYHLDRGYERIEDKLSACGATIRRIKA